MADPNARPSLIVDDVHVHYRTFGGRRLPEGASWSSRLRRHVGARATVVEWSPRRPIPDGVDVIACALPPGDDVPLVLAALDAGVSVATSGDEHDGIAQSIAQGLADRLQRLKDASISAILKKADGEQGRPDLKALLEIIQLANADKLAGVMTDDLAAFLRQLLQECQLASVNILNICADELPHNRTVILQYVVEVHICKVTEIQIKKPVPLRGYIFMT